jgi:hypothetical protein
MAVHKLILDDVFDESVFTLIAIHCNIEDYRLAYLLNQFLGINLVRNEFDLDFNKGKTAYSLYQWKDKKQLINWNLVSNICKTNAFSQTNTNSLFDTVTNITKTFNLIPELKNVNYLLKIEDELDSNEYKEIINKTLRIPQVATAYIVDYSQLKSKDNLIFS